MPMRRSTRRRTPVLARRSYDRLKPQWRIAIALGGPAANFVLAFLFYWLVAVIARRSRYRLPRSRQTATRIGPGMRSGEKIVAVDGEPINTWSEVGMALVARLGDSGEIEIETTKDGRAQSRSLAVDRWHSESEDPTCWIRLASTCCGRPPSAKSSLASALSRAGCAPGDRVTRVNGETVAQWSELVGHAQSNPGDGAVGVGGARVRFADAARHASAPVRRRRQRIRLLGAIAGDVPVQVLRKNPLAAIGEAAADTWSFSVLTVQLIGKMLTLDVSPKNVAGPITIAKVSGDSAHAGVGAYLTLLAILSINLGIINLLPIPILDGGQVLFNALELVRRKPPFRLDGGGNRASGHSDGGRADGAGVLCRHHALAVAEFLVAGRRNR